MENRFTISSEFHIPCMEEVKKYCSRWVGGEEEKEKYSAQNSAIINLFNLYPKNTDMDVVLVKIATLDKFYSTNIRKPYKLAKHIISIKDMDNKLEKNDLSLVDDVANAKYYDKVLYSFASKYCSFHKPTVYPIYDSNARVALQYFYRSIRDENGNSVLPAEIFENIALGKNNNHNYLNYVNAIKVFIDTFDLKVNGEYDYKMIDAYLWKIGKEMKK